MVIKRLHKPLDVLPVTKSVSEAWLVRKCYGPEVHVNRIGNGGRAQGIRFALRQAGMVTWKSDRGENMWMRPAKCACHGEAPTP